MDRRPGGSERSHHVPSLLALAFLRLLAKVELRAAGAVLLVAAAVGVIFFVYSVIEAPQGFLPPHSWSILAFVYAVVFGLPVAVLAGAPVYALLSYKNAASWPVVLLLGVLPGLVILFTMEQELDLALWFIGCGATVALLTHVMTTRSRKKGSL